MAKNKTGKQKAAAESSRSGIGRTLLRGFGTLLGLFLMLYLTLLAASRTAGFVTLAERRLARFFPPELRLSSVRLLPPLRLYLHDVQAGAGDDPVFSAAEMTLVYSPAHALRGRLRLEALQIRNARVVFEEPDLASAVSPDPQAFFAWAWRLFPAGSFVPFPHAGPPEGSSISTGWDAPGAWDLRWPGYRVHIDGADIEWRTRESETIAVLRSLCLHSTPLSVPERRITHLYLEAAEWRSGSDSMRYGYTVEWLAHERLRWILFLDPSENRPYRDAHDHDPVAEVLRAGGASQGCVRKE